MNGEEEHLLNTEVVEEPPRSRKALAAVVVAATLAAGGVVATSSAGIAPPSTTLQDKAPSTELAWTDTDSSDGWYIYKVAYPGRNGTTEDLLTFMTDFRCKKIEAPLSSAPPRAICQGAVARKWLRRTLRVSLPALRRPPPPFFFKRAFPLSPFLAPSRESMPPFPSPRAAQRRHGLRDREPRVRRVQAHVLLRV